MAKPVVFFAALLLTFGAVNCFRIINGGTKLKHVSTSVNYIWGVAANDDIYRCNRPCNGAWVKVNGKLKQIDVGDEEVWGVNAANQIWKRPADGSGNWVRINGALKHVSASGNGYIWGVNAGNNIYKCKKPCKGAWAQVPGGLSQIDAGHDYVYGVNTAGNVYSRPVDGSGSWRQIPGLALKHVTASAREEVFGVSKARQLYRCKKPCVVGEWELMGESLDQVDGTFDSIVGVDSETDIYEHNTGI